nr:MAG TPA: hypothetical protein [Caudoviricetes sp.]
MHCIFVYFVILLMIIGKSEFSFIQTYKLLTTKLLYGII